MDNKGRAVALGYFDGVHLGHKAVLQKTHSLAEEKGLTASVLFFSSHPKKLLTGNAPPKITDDEMRGKILKEMGFELIPFDFKKSMNMPPRTFAEDYIAKALRAKAVVCGYDFRYGKGGSGNVQSLKEDLENKEILVCSIGKVLLDDDTISSSKIRQLISLGDVERANKMLGRVFSYDRVVEKGDALGRKLGFPTINQSFPKDFIVPKFGVYASVVTLNAKKYPGVTNIGVRPTVDGENLKSETCILGFSGDLYGKRAQVGLIRFLRQEMKFSCLEDLSKTVKGDMEKARSVYNEVIENG